MHEPLILGIDPGAHTGIAIFIGGQLWDLQTIEPAQIERTLRNRLPNRVIFEDSRLQSRAWTARGKGTQGAALATARSLGQVDAWCSLISSICAEIGISAHGISPKAKGAKLDAEQFALKTGWGKPSNQHCRDAAMVAWPYRGARYG